MNIDPSIFKAYDIRGLYPQQLDEQAAYAIGRAFATLLITENSGKKLTVGVGGDMRLSTPSLKDQAICALRDSGINVVDLGLVSTTTYYFAVSQFGHDGGLQVSASHNPKQYNGFKLVRQRAAALSGDSGIKELYKIISNETYSPLLKQPGSLEIKTKVADYVVEQYLKDIEVSNIKPFKIVIDPANAMGVIDYQALFDRLPQCQIVKINFDLDGTFPNHEADPLKPENTEQLRKRVIAEKADFGIASDGDSDRIFIIDETGKTISSSILFTIISQIELDHNPGQKLAYEIRLGKLIEDELADKASQLIQTPVGHSIIKKIMTDNEVLFGGEISGHYFFRMSCGTFEAPALLVAKFMQYISEQNQPVSEIVAKYQKYISSGEINTELDSKEMIDQKITELKVIYHQGEQIMIDGLKVNFSDYWFSVRASNTEPVIRLVVEANNQELMEKKRDEILAIIRS